MHKFMPLDLFLVFLQQTCPIHYFRSKTHAILLPHPTRCKNLYQGAFNARDCASKTIFLLGRNEHAQSTTLGLKLIFKIFLDTSMHFYIAFDDT